MRDKEIIEGMVKVDIEESAGFYSAFINDMRISKNKPLSISKTVMSFDCPKKYILQAIGIPEGSVIVSKQIWEEHIEKREKANKIFEEQVRKETAKEILQELYDQVDEKTPKWVETQIKMKAKQFGVEVEE